MVFNGESPLDADAAKLMHAPAPCLSSCKFWNANEGLFGDQTRRSVLVDDSCIVLSEVSMTGRTRVMSVAAITAATFCPLALAVETNGISAFDATVRTYVHGLASPFLTYCAQKVTSLGSLDVRTFVGVSAIAALARAGRRREAVLLLMIMVGALALENVIKFSFQRARPTQFFGTEPTTYSFPSGHALFSACVYGGLAIMTTSAVQTYAVKNAILIATVLLVLAIGATRIYLGMHYPSDVLGGYLVAIAWLVNRSGFAGG